jgi:hypothetical protein
MGQIKKNLAAQGRVACPRKSPCGEHWIDSCTYLLPIPRWTQILMSLCGPGSKQEIALLTLSPNA